MKQTAALRTPHWWRRHSRQISNIIRVSFCNIIFRGIFWHIKGGSRIFTRAPYQRGGCPDTLDIPWIRPCTCIL